MDKDDIEGLAAKVAGSFKEAIGKVTGDTRLEAEGSAQKAKGNAKNVSSGAKSSVRNAGKK